MTRHTRSALPAVLICLLWPLAAWSESFAFTDTSGKPQQVADHTGGGQWTVLMIWASDCGICRAEAPELEAFYQRHKGLDARVVGLSIDGPKGLQQARDFITDEGLSFPNLVGEGEDVATLFHDETGNHLYGTPAFLVFNPDGKLRTFQTGRLNIQLLENLIRAQPPVAIAEGR